MGRNPNWADDSSAMVRKLFTTALIVVFLVLAGGAGLFVFDQVRAFIATSDVLPNFTIEDEGPSNVSYKPGEPLPRWKGTDRVNILVMGIDQREHEQGPWRTDTMLILTIDPVTMNAGMLSIPRDLWVPSPVPGYPEARINQAHFFGDVYNYPGGGPALAVKTVEYNFGIQIHHYARINFAAFERLVDLIGGIDVEVAEEINDPTYPARDNYGYDPFYLAAGEQHLDGEMALKYARTRHTSGGDFDRARRQQQVIMAIFEKVTQHDLLAQLAPKANELWSTLQGAVVTDLKLDEVIALANLASEVGMENVHHYVVDEHYTQFWETPDGQLVLIPLRERIRELRDCMFTAHPSSPEDDDPAAQLAAEAARVKVLNGTTVAGLAGCTTEYLEQEGLQVVEPGNANRSDYADSIIIVYGDKAYTAKYAATLLGLPEEAIIYGGNDSSGEREFDISITLGANFQPPAQCEGSQ